jgi:hypothetical protein
MLGGKKIRIVGLVAAAVLLPLGVISAAPSAAVGTLDVSYTEFNDSVEFIGISAAQTFTAGAAGNLVQVDLPLSAVGSPDPLAVQIFATASGAPTGSALATGTVNASQVGSSDTEPTWVSVVLSAPVPSVVGAQYAIALTPPANSEEGNAFIVFGSIPGTYPGGTAFVSQDAGATWIPTEADEVGGVEQDLSFKTYVGSTCVLITGPRPGSLNLQGGSWCITDASIGGTLSVGSGASVVITRSTFSGAINASGPAAFQLCASKVGSNLTVVDATGPVVIGDGGACATNSPMPGHVTLSRNRAGVRFQDNTVAAHVTVTSNVVTGSGVNVISHNTIRGNLTCSGNNPPASNLGSANTVGGRRSGECAAASF